MTKSYYRDFTGRDAYELAWDYAEQRSGLVTTFGFWLQMNIDRECLSKRRYSNESEAEDEARILFNEGNGDLHPYSWPGRTGVRLTSRRRSR